MTADPRDLQSHPAAYSEEMLRKLLSVRPRPLLTSTLPAETRQQRRARERAERKALRSAMKRRRVQW